MPVTVAEARDQMAQVLKDALEASTDFQDLFVLWDDTDGDPPTSVDTPWARFVVKHAKGNQSSLSGANNTRRYTRNGVLAVQLFTTQGNGHSTSDALVSMIMQAYEQGSAPNGVWYRNVRLQEQGNSGGWTQVNVYAEFEYDEVR